MIKYLFLFAGVLLLASAAPTDDLVHLAIPGYTAHNWYSGYLEFDTGSFHYVFFDSQRDPDNDPVVLWLNGGPGCSSLLGMTYETGPFVFQEGTANFEINPYAWNLKANLLYLESPGGVGFSESKRGVKSDDGTVAEDNYKALLAFYEKFPKLKSNSFYMSGESYAGIYIPYLANEILRGNRLPSSQTKIKLEGIMINNACTDPRECYEPGNDINLSIYQYENLYHHGYYTQTEFDRIKGACWLGYGSQACVDVRKTMDKIFYDTNTSMLNLYSKCLYQKVAGAEGKQFVRLPHGKVPLMADGVICEDMYGISHFFNQPTIQTRLNVKPQSF